MAQLEFDPQEMAIADQRSYVIPEKPEYTQNKWSALAHTVNSGYALYKVGEASAQALADPIDIDTPFSRESLRDYLKENNYSPKVTEEVMTTPLNSWNEAQARILSVEGYEKSQQQAAEEFPNPFTRFVASVPFAVLDIDSPAGVPIFKAAKALTKSPIATGVVTGAGTAVFSNATYETATGVQEEGSYVTSLLLGAGLGGAAGFLGRNTPQDGKFTDREGKVVTKQQKQAEALAEKNKEVEEISELIDEVEQLIQGKKETTDLVEEAEIRDRKFDRVDRRIVKEKLQQLKEQATKLLDDENAVVAASARAIEDLTNRTVDNVWEVARLKSEIANLRKAQDEIKKLTDKNGTKTGQIKELQRRLDELKDKPDRKSIDKRVAIRTKIAKLKDEIAPDVARIQTLQTRINKIDPENETKLKQLEEERVLLDKTVSNRAKQLAKEVARRDEAEAKATKAKEDADNYKTRVTKENARYSKETLTLRDRLEAYGVQLSSDSIRDLLEKRNLLTDEARKLADGEFTPELLKQLKANRVDEALKLDKELKAIDEAIDFRDTDAYKALPNWAQKLVISPIQKVLGSENAMVRGLAKRLHSGTMHRGKINNRNAWNLRLLMDTELDRMHKAVIFSYRMAVRDGYTGKFEDFEREVADAARQVTGKMQRQMYTGVEGGANAKERIEIAKQRAGSVQRQHESNNEFIDKAVDAYLNYYENIHKRGSQLNMEAFRGSIGKGYVRRIYSQEKINNMQYQGLSGPEAAEKYLVDAQEEWAIATNSEFNLEDAQAKAKAAINSALDRDMRRQEVVKELGIPKQSTESSLKTRTIDAFDDTLSEVLESNVMETSHIYGLNTHGRIALKEALGADNDNQIEALISQVGATSEEAQNIRVMVETIKGTREISKNPFDPFTRAVKMGSSYSSAMHTLGFVVPTITEVASVAKEFGWTKTMEGLIGSPRAIIDMYRNGTAADKNTIELMISYGDAYFANKVTRYDNDAGMVDSVGRVQGFLDGTVSRMAVYGGLLPVTDMLRMTTASLSVDFLARMSVAKNISKTDRMRLQDMGFDLEDLARVRKTLNVQADGRIGNMDRKTWGDLDEEITLGVQTMVERTILHPNGITLPKFMTNVNEGQFLPRIMFKFMRFPFESYERMLLRGIQEADAKQALALAGNVAIWTFLLQAKDALKDEEKQKYSGEDGMNQLFIDAMVMNSFTAGPVAFADTFSGLTTGKQIVSGYPYSIGGVLSTDYQRLLRGDPVVSVPFASVGIPEGTANSVRAMMGLEETVKE